MNTPEIDPRYWQVDTLISCGLDTIHGLALSAAGTLTSYRVILGRCLLALDESKLYREFGCSGSVNYATTILGQPRDAAYSARRVADALRALPHLSTAAENGTIDWGKLREITRKATAETERYWLELARRCNYREIQFLVSRTPKGSLPGEVEPETSGSKTELRCPLEPGVFNLLEQARAVLATREDAAKTTGEVLEWVLAAFLSSEPMSKDVLEKARRAMDKDLAADQARAHPTVWRARELALEMGLFGKVEEDGRCVHSPEGDGSTPAKQAAPAEDPPLQLEDELAQALGLQAVELPARVQNPALLLDDELPQALGLHTAELPARTQNPSGQRPKTPNQDWENERISFNPTARHTTKAQRRELIRREGYCCATPGCPNRLWLQLHHITPYSEGGRTVSSNLICLCTRCHRNVHEGHLFITRKANGQLQFKDREGRALDRVVDLEVAGWLDRWIGWSGKRWDCHRYRAHTKTWSVTQSLTYSG